MLIALVVAVTPLSAVTPAQAETCQEAITLFSGTPFQQTFPRVCGEEARMALWNNSLGPYLDANSGPAAAWSMAQAATQEAARVAAEVAAAEAAARQAADAALADAANCVDAVTTFAGDPVYETFFPAICTAAGIAARAQAIQDYFDFVTADRAAKQNSAPINPVPPNSSNGYINNPGIGIDCGTPEGMNSAWCINQQQGYNPNTGIWGTPPVNPTNPVDAFNCALPQNAVLPTCGNQGPLTFQDGTLNCANPVNVVLASCMTLFNSGVNGALDCTRSELRTLPACLNGTTTGGTTTGGTTFNANTQPMVNADGSMNCAQAANAITTTCMDLFRLSANGTLDCSRAELKNLPACVNGTAPGGVNAPTPPSNLPTSAPNVSAPTTNLPPTTGGVVAQPNLPNAPSNTGSSSNQVASEKITKNKEDLFPDADGEEEDPAANLTVTYSKTLARYIVKVDSNLAEESLVIRGVKKGSKSLKFTLNTDEDGVAGVKTKTKLAGFTLTLYFGSTKLDSVKVS
jgi:hypothetical protein